MRGLC